jgi:FkbM family methyltransferase
LNFPSFLYRQRQRWNYHFASNDVERQIAEINKYKQFIKSNHTGYLIEEINLLLPKGKFDYIFYRYDLFLNNARNLSGKYIIENGLLFFSWEDFKVRISSPSELFIINEIFVEKCYNFILPQLKINIIDIGMNVGLASLFFASHPQVNKVFAFEPFIITFDLAVANFGLNPHLKPKIFPHNYGLGSKKGTIQIPFNPDNLGVNTTNAFSPRIASANSTDRVRINNVADEIECILEGTVDEMYIIKIDTEGAEYEIFEKLFERNLDSNIIGFILEWHYKGAKLLEEQLVNEGFKVFSTIISNNTGLIYAIR